MTLTQDMIELLAAGVAHQVGACSAQGRPLLCRGLAAEVEENGKMVVILSGESAFEVLAAIRENGRVSVNVTYPKNFRSLNWAGRDATVARAGSRYRKLVDERHRAFREQLIPYGFLPELTSAWYNVPDDDLMLVRFTPIAARNQTPGPGAGNVIELKN
jgi:hypothetical protein